MASRGPRPSRRNTPRGSAAGSQYTTTSCKRCRLRKVKCDAALPSCSPCSRMGASCIVADSSTTREYTRVEALQLQERLWYLQRLLATQSPIAQELGRDTPGDLSVQTQESQPQAQGFGQSPSRYVGHEVGVEFLRNLLEAIRKPPSAASRSLLVPQLLVSPMVYHDPHPLPPRPDVARIVANYLTEFHTEHTFLDPGRLSDLFSNLYGEPDPHPAQASQRASKEDLFQANMILALGSIGLYRSGTLDLDPFGFFTAALEASPPFGFSFGSVQDIENVLLIAHFGVFYNIGCSIWELSRVCIRMCIELQLHLKYDGTSAQELEEVQRRRRVFWESYRLDRFSSSTLGRPFAIIDAIITVEYPECCPVTELRTLGFWENVRHQLPRNDQLTDGKVFIHLLKLSRITSQLHYLHQLQRTGHSESDAQGLPKSAFGAREGYGKLRLLAAELQEWRRDIPSYDEPACPSQVKESFELCFHKENLYLIRIAIDLSSSSRGRRPPVYLMGPCMMAACNLIETFDNLRRGGLVPWTRANTYLIFMTSLIIVFVTFSQAQSSPHQRELTRRDPSLVDVESWWADLVEDADEHPTQDKQLHALSVAAAILDWMASHMPDIQSYAQCLEVLRHELEREIAKAASSLDVARMQASSIALAPDVRLDITENIPEEPSTEHFMESMPNRFENQPADYTDPANTGLGPLDLAPDNAMEGILSNFFPTVENPGDFDVFQPTQGSWPFSHIPWFESIYPEMSGFDEDISFNQYL